MNLRHTSPTPSPCATGFKLTSASLWLTLALGMPCFASATPLGDVLNAALSHPAVRARQGQAAGARDDLSAATARYAGRGSLIADQTRYEGKHVVGYFYPGQPTPAILDDNISRYGLSYILPIDLFGVIAASRERAKNNLLASELLAQQETLLHLHQALSAYSRKQALQSQAEALKLQRERIEMSVDRIRKEVELGRTAGIDLSLAESDLARLLADEARLQGILGDTRADLVDASGQDPDVSSRVVAAPAWQDMQAEQTLSVRVAQARADGLANAASEARRNLLPALNVGADYFNNRGGNGDMTTWALGLRLNVPLDASAAWRVSGDAARTAAAQDDVQASRQTAKRQINSLKAAYDSATADALALTKEVTYRSEVVEVEQQKWQLGAQTLENLLRQRRDLLDAQYRLADARTRTVAAWSSAQVLAGTEPATYIEQLDK